MNESQVASAIEPLVIALRADGADVIVDGIDGSAVDLRLVVEGASCSDCVMPASVLVELFEGAVRDAGFSVTEIRLSDPREA